MLTFKPLIRDKATKGQNRSDVQYKPLQNTLLYPTTRISYNLFVSGLIHYEVLTILGLTFRGTVLCTNKRQSFAQTRSLSAQ